MVATWLYLQTGGRGWLPLGCTYKLVEEGGCHLVVLTNWWKRVVATWLYLQIGGRGWLPLGCTYKLVEEGGCHMVVLTNWWKRVVVTWLYLQTGRGWLPVTYLLTNWWKRLVATLLYLQNWKRVVAGHLLTYKLVEEGGLPHSCTYKLVEEGGCHIAVLTKWWKMVVSTWLYFTNWWKKVVATWLYLQIGGRGWLLHGCTYKMVEEGGCHMVVLYKLVEEGGCHLVATWLYLQIGGREWLPLGCGPRRTVALPSRRFSRRNNPRCRWRSTLVRTQRPGKTKHHWWLRMKKKFKSLFFLSSLINLWLLEPQ